SGQTYTAHVTVSDDATHMTMRSVPITVDTVPSSPSVVSISGRQLLVQRRNPDGSLAAAAPYVIRGVNWSPASRTPPGPLPGDRRLEFGRWFTIDLPLIKAMNANTIRLFLGPGVVSDDELIVSGRAILDECYRNGLMVVVTVDDGNNSVARITPLIE